MLKLSDEPVASAIVTLVVSAQAVSSKVPLLAILVSSKWPVAAAPTPPSVVATVTSVGAVADAEETVISVTSVEAVEEVKVATASPVMLSDANPVRVARERTNPSEHAGYTKISCCRVGRDIGECISDLDISQIWRSRSGSSQPP